MMTSSPLHSARLLIAAWLIAGGLDRAPACAAAPPAAAQTVTKAATQTAAQKPLESPRLDQLRREVAQGASTDAFWEEMGRRGTPLIESAESSHAGSNAGPNVLLVTFLWRHTSDTTSVRLFWPVRAVRPEDDELQRLPDTDVWFKTMRLPKGARLSYQLAPNVGKGDGSRESRRRALLAAAQPDPLNPRRWTEAQSSGARTSEVRAASSILEAPGAARYPWNQAVATPAAGAVTVHRFSSERLKNSRDVHVYLPPGDRPAVDALPLLVLFDADEYLQQVRAPALLDALIAGKHIPPIAAVLIGYAARDDRGRELPPNPAFAAFLGDELLPWMRRSYPITADPSRVVVSGSSYGGVAATYAAMTHPELFGNVLSQSGSFWWSPTQDPARQDAFDEFSEPNWFARELAGRPRLPVRFYLNAGLLEEGSDILPSTRHMRDVLIARGYTVDFETFPGGHDYLSWRDGLARGLITLFASPAAALPASPPASAATSPLR